MLNGAPEMGAWSAERKDRPERPLLTIVLHLIPPLQEVYTESRMKELIASDPFAAKLIGSKACELSRKRGCSRSDRDDLQQEIRLYMLERLRACGTVHNPRSFAKNTVGTWFRMELRYRQREKRAPSFGTISLECTPVVCDGEITTQRAVLREADGWRLSQTEPRTFFEHVEVRDVVDHAMEGLSPEDRAIVAHVAEHGRKSASRAFGMSCRQIYNRVGSRRVQSRVRGSVSAVAIRDKQ